MADPFQSPQQRATWEALAHEHGETQRKLLAERKRVQKLLTGLNRAPGGPASPEEQRHKALFQAFLENFLRQVQLQDPDSPVWEVPTPATLLQLEWEGLEAQALLLQMDQLQLERLFRRLEADMAVKPARTGPLRTAPLRTGPLRTVLPAYDGVLAQVATRPEWQEAIERFLADYPAYRTQVADLVTRWDAARALPLPERLPAAKALNVPSLKGTHYRLEALFRRLPEGEAFLSAFRFAHAVPALDAAEGPGGPAAGGSPVKRSLTERLREIWKPTKE